MLVRAVLLLKKLDTLTDEEFFKYLEGPHTNFVVNCSIMKERGIKFSTYPIDKVFTSTLTAYGFQMLEFDSECHFRCASMEDLMAMLNDPEFQRTVVADGPAFHKQKEARLMVVYDKDITTDQKIM